MLASDIRTKSQALNCLEQLKGASNIRESNLIVKRIVGDNGFSKGEECEVLYAYNLNRKAKYCVRTSKGEYRPYCTASKFETIEDETFTIEKLKSLYKEIDRIEAEIIKLTRTLVENQTKS